MEKLTNKEEEVMHALWRLDGQDLHYNTVSTMIRNLEEKGFVGHKAYGKTHQYYPLVPRDVYGKKFMNDATQKFSTVVIKIWYPFLRKRKKSPQRSFEKSWI